MGGYHKSNEEIYDMSYVIGVDVSKENLDCAHLRNKEQNKPKRKTCGNKVCGFKSLVEWSEKVTGLA